MDVTIMDALVPKETLFESTDGTTLVVLHKTPAGEVVLKTWSQERVRRGANHLQAATEYGCQLRLAAHPHFNTPLAVGLEEDRALSFYVNCGKNVKDWRQYIIHNHSPDQFIIAEQMTQHVAAYLMLALDYLGKQGTVHRDVTPTNIMMRSFDRIDPSNPSQCKFGDVLLADMGIACGIQNLEGFIPGSNPEYVAPELVTYDQSTRLFQTNLDPQQTCALAKPAADVFQAGVVLFETFTGVKPPYLAEKLAKITDPVSLSEYLFAVITCDWNYWITECVRDICPPLANMLDRMLVLDPDQRATVEELMRHDFLADKCAEAAANMQQKQLQWILERQQATSAMWWVTASRAGVQLDSFISMWHSIAATQAAAAAASLVAPVDATAAAAAAPAAASIMADVSDGAAADTEQQSEQSEQVFSMTVAEHHSASIDETHSWYLPDPAILAGAPRGATVAEGGSSPSRDVADVAVPSQAPTQSAPSSDVATANSSSNDGNGSSNDGNSSSSNDGNSSSNDGNSNSSNLNSIKSNSSNDGQNSSNSVIVPCKVVSAPQFPLPDTLALEVITTDAGVDAVGAVLQFTLTSSDATDATDDAAATGIAATGIVSTGGSSNIRSKGTWWDKLYAPNTQITGQDSTSCNSDVLGAYTKEAAAADATDDAAATGIAATATGMASTGGSSNVRSKRTWWDKLYAPQSQVTGQDNNSPSDSNLLGRYMWEAAAATSAAMAASHSSNPHHDAVKTAGAGDQHRIKRKIIKRNSIRRKSFKRKSRISNSVSDTSDNALDGDMTIRGNSTEGVSTGGVCTTSGVHGVVAGVATAVAGLWAGFYVAIDGVSCGVREAAAGNVLGGMICAADAVLVGVCGSVGAAVDAFGMATRA